MDFYNIIQNLIQNLFRKRLSRQLGLEKFACHEMCATKNVYQQKCNTYTFGIIHILYSVIIHKLSAAPISNPNYNYVFLVTYWFYNMLRTYFYISFH